MSRSGYVNAYDTWSLIRWRGAVNSALRGRRGQEFLRELSRAMDEMEEKKLIAEDLEFNGAFCAIGTVGNKRKIDMSDIDVYDAEKVAKVFGIAPAMVKEIVYMNDEGVFYEESEEQRWLRMRKWVDAQLEKEER